MIKRDYSLNSMKSFFNQWDCFIAGTNDILGKIYLKIILPFELGCVRYRQYMGFLDESQWWPKEKLEVYQFSQLQLLLRHAYTNIPYYRQLFKRHNLTLANFKSLDDLQKLPILTKQDIRNNFDKIITEGVGKKDLLLNTTSGSSGMPLKFLLDNKMAQEERIHFFWLKTLTGRKYYDKFVRFWSKPFVNNQSSFYSYYPKGRCLFLSAIALDEHKVYKSLKLIKNFKPGVVMGMPSLLYTFACFVKRNNIDDITFPVFVSVAENMHAFQRNFIQEQFKCEIFSWYSQEEHKWIAFECDKHEGMHIDTRRGVLEIIGESGRRIPHEEKGKIVYTGFRNNIMPLIRYDTGDIGSVSKQRCSCGRGFPLFKSFDGRVSEILICNGKYLYPTALSVLMEDLVTIKECQFVQEKRNAIILRIVRKETYTAQDSERLLSKLRQFLGDAVEIEINFVDYIPRTVMGKFPFVVSKLNDTQLSN